MPGGLRPFSECSPSPRGPGPAAAEAPIPAPSPGQPPATILSVNFEGLDTIAPSVTVPVGTAITPAATLAGVGAPHATGTVTYSVYLDDQCQIAAGAPVVAVDSNSGRPAGRAIGGTRGGDLLLESGLHLRRSVPRIGSVLLDAVRTGRSA